MFIKPIIKCFLVFGLCYTAQSYAMCTRTNTPATDVNIGMGKVIVSPNAKIGDQLAQSITTIGSSDSSRHLFDCTAGSTIEAEVNPSLLTNGTNKIYQTNVPGIGMEIRRDSGYAYTYPFTYTSNSGGGVYIGVGKFIVTLYKISENVGAGPLTAGTYSWYKAPESDLSQSALNSILFTNGTIIVTPSCSVTSGAQQNVYLDSVKYSELNAVGSTANDTSFSIQLKCTGGASVNVGYDNVELTFSGTIPTSLTNSDGVLVNDVESTGAKGVGIQVLDNDKKPLKFDSKYTVGSLTGAESGYNITTNYTARYYRYGSTISPGPVQSKMVFAITYD